MTATTAHAGTQAGIRPVLLGCPHCGIPALLLRIDPDPGHRHPDQPRPVRPDGYTVHRVEHTPTAALEPRTLGASDASAAAGAPPPPTFPTTSRPPGGRPAPHRKEQPCPSPSSPATPPPTPRSVSLRYSLVSRRVPRGVRGRGSRLPGQMRPWTRWCAPRLRGRGRRSGACRHRHQPSLRRRRLQPGAAGQR